MIGHIIDLPERPRWGAGCVEKLADCGIAGRIFAGSTQADGLSMDNRSFARKYGRNPHAGEIGCFASHWRIAKAAAAGEVAAVSDEHPEWWLVFEDDAIPEGGMCAAVMLEIIKQAENIGYDFVFLHPGRNGQRTKGPMRLTDAPVNEIYSHAYLASAKGMRTIAAFKMHDPIDKALARSPSLRCGALWGPDHFRQRPREHGVPAIFWERRGGGRIIADCTLPRRGLGNQLTVLLSGYAAAVVRGWDLTVVWRAVARCGAEWDELFQPLEGIEFARSIKGNGHIHRAAHYSDKTRSDHLTAAGPNRYSEGYWDAWRGLAKRIELIPALALPETPPFDAVSLRTTHPNQPIGDYWSDKLPDLVRPFIAADAKPAWETAKERYPDAWWLTETFQAKDTDKRGLAHMQTAARDMMMLTKARSIYTVGGPSTFRNLAHIGYQVPLWKIYEGPAP